MCSITACAADWPQFRGPNRDGVSTETGLLKEWPKDGPALLWSYKDAGVGYSGPAIIGERLYLTGGRGDSEFVFALDLSAHPPKELWAAKIGPLFQWKGNSWNEGPNATPTIDGELLYALGGGGELVCVETADGKVRWRKNMPRDFSGEVNPIGGGAEEPTPLGWGYAWSPLVDGDQLICIPGGPKGLMAALNKKTGELVWRCKDAKDQAPYSSPVIAEIGGVRQYVQSVNSGIVGIAAKDGKLLWAYQRDPAYDDVVIANPIVQGNRVFATVGFGQGFDLIEISNEGGSFKTQKVLSSKSIQNKLGGVVLVDGHLYGHSESGGWFCHVFKTGANVWSERTKIGPGSVTFADGRLYCCAEKGGIVVLLEASPKGWNEKGRFKLPQESKLRKPNGLMWVHPVIANGRLYIRDQEFLMCFDVRQVQK
jgi:outer membrane protein assembly factor BamB